MLINTLLNSKTFDFTVGEIPFEFSINPVYDNRIETWAEMYSKTAPEKYDKVKMLLPDCIGTFVIQDVNKKGRNVYRVNLKLIIQEC